MTPARALGHRKRRAARRLRRMKIQWHEKDGRWWLTASHWPRAGPGRSGSSLPTTLLLSLVPLSQRHCVLRAAADEVQRFEQPRRFRRDRRRDIIHKPDDALQEFQPALPNRAGEPSHTGAPHSWHAPAVVPATVSG